MKTREFIELLEQNPGKSLLFEYRHGETVAPDYHITEIKNVSIDSVDCGAGTDFWRETILQLWESPVEKESRTYMSSYKAMSIINKVDKIKPLHKDAVIKFEYGNEAFHTAQLPVMGVEIGAQQLRIKLVPDITDCKAKSDCGIPEEAAAASVSNCNPSSGCC